MAEEPTTAPVGPPQPQPTQDDLERYFMGKYDEGRNSGGVIQATTGPRGNLALEEDWGLKRSDVTNLARTLAPLVMPNVYPGTYFGVITPSGTQVYTIVGTIFTKLGSSDARLRVAAARALDIRDDPSGSGLERVRMEYAEAMEELRQENFAPLAALREVGELVRDAVTRAVGWTSHPGTLAALDMWNQVEEVLVQFLSMQRERQSAKLRSLGTISYPEEKGRARAFVERGAMADALREAMRYMDLILGQVGPATEADFTSVFPDTADDSGARTPSRTARAGTREVPGGRDLGAYDFYDYRRQALRLLATRLTHGKTQMDRLYASYLDIASEKLSALPSAADRTPEQHGLASALVDLPPWYGLPEDAYGAASRRKFPDPSIRIIAATGASLWTNFVANTIMIRGWGIEVPSLSEIVHMTNILIPRDDRVDPMEQEILKARADRAYSLVLALTKLWDKALDEREASMSGLVRAIVEDINTGDGPARRSATVLNSYDMMTNPNLETEAMTTIKQWLANVEGAGIFYRNAEIASLNGFRDSVRSAPFRPSAPEEWERKVWSTPGEFVYIDFDAAAEVTRWVGSPEVPTDANIASVHWFSLAMQAWIIGTTDVMVTTLRRDFNMAFGAYPLVKALYSSAINAMVRTQYVRVYEELAADLRVKAQARWTLVKERWIEVPELAGSALTVVKGVQAERVNSIPSSDLAVLLQELSSPSASLAGKPRSATFEHHSRLKASTAEEMAKGSALDTDEEWRLLQIIDALAGSLLRAEVRTYDAAVDVYNRFRRTKEDPLWRARPDLAEAFGEGTGTRRELSSAFTEAAKEAKETRGMSQEARQQRALESLIIRLRTLSSRLVAVVETRSLAALADLKERSTLTARSTELYLSEYASAAATAKRLLSRVAEARKALAYGTQRNRYVSLVVTFDAQVLDLERYVTAGEANAAALGSAQKALDAVLGSRRLEVEKRSSLVASVFSNASGQLGSLLDSLGVASAIKNAKMEARELGAAAEAAITASRDRFKAVLSDEASGTLLTHMDLTQEVLKGVDHSVTALEAFSEGYSLCEPDVQSAVDEFLCSALRQRLGDARRLSAESRSSISAVGIPVSPSFDPQTRPAGRGGSPTSIETASVDTFFSHFASDARDELARALSETERAFNVAKAATAREFQYLTQRAKRLSDNLETARRRHFGSDTGGGGPGGSTRGPGPGDSAEVDSARREIEAVAQTLVEKESRALDGLEELRAGQVSRLNLDHRKQRERTREVQGRVMRMVLLTGQVETAVVQSSTPINATHSLVNAWYAFDWWMGVTERSLADDVRAPAERELVDVNNRTREIEARVRSVVASVQEITAIERDIIATEEVDLANETLADRAARRAGLLEKLRRASAMRMQAELDRFGVASAQASIRSVVDTLSAKLDAQTTALRSRLELERQAIRTALTTATSVLDNAPVPIPPLAYGAEPRAEERRGARGLVGELYRQLAHKIQLVKELNLSSATESRLQRLVSELANLSTRIKNHTDQYDRTLANEIEAMQISLKNTQQLEETARAVVNRVLPGITQVRDAERRRTEAESRRFGLEGIAPRPGTEPPGRAGGEGRGGREGSAVPGAARRGPRGDPEHLRKLQIPRWLDVFRPSLERLPAIKNNPHNFSPDAYGSRLLVESMPSDAVGLFCGNVFVTQAHMRTAMDVAFSSRLPYAGGEPERLAACYILHVHRGRIRHPNKCAIKAGDTWRTRLEDLDFSSAPGTPIPLLQELKARMAAYALRGDILSLSPSAEPVDPAARMELVATTSSRPRGELVHGVRPSEEKLAVVSPTAFYTPVWGNVHASPGRSAGTLDFEAYRDQDPDGASEPIQNTLVLVAEGRHAERGGAPADPYHRFVLRHTGADRLPVGTILGIFTGRVIPMRRDKPNVPQSSQETADVANLNHPSMKKFRVIFDDEDYRLDSSRFGSELRFIMYNRDEALPGEQNADIYYLKDPKDDTVNASVVISTRVISKGDPIVMLSDEE